jgi:integrase
MRESKQNGGIARHRGWWVVRYREQVGIEGVVKTRMRAKRLARVDAEHKTKASVRKLADAVLKPLNRNWVPPLSVTTIGDFIERVYLPYVKQQKRPSTYRGYGQIWNVYLAEPCGRQWLREARTYHVQAWLEAIARMPRTRNKQEYTLSKTTLAHIKNFLSGVFRHASQQGYFDGVNPVTLAEIPAFAPKGKEGRAYSLEDIGLMLTVLPEPAATVVATAAYTGLRLGELQGLTWIDYSPPAESDELGLLHVRRSVWRGIIGEPKTEKSKSAVPVVRQLEIRLASFRKSLKTPDGSPIFANGVGKPMDLNALYYRQMRDVLRNAGISWLGWHGFRRGLASNLNRLGVDDSVIQAILRHSDVSITQRCYIKTAKPEAIAAMRQLSERVAEVQRQSASAFECFSGAENPVEGKVQ